jgi:perosamine synthetase
MIYLPPDPPLTPADLLRLVRVGNGLRGFPDGPFFASGRAALLAGLRALGVGADDEVLLPAYLCESVVTPVEAMGARPVFYPTSRSLGVDMGAVEAAIGPRTRAVVVIHYFGFPGPVRELRDVCTRRGVALIEDCAHALYSRDGDRPLGTVGDAAIFSPWKSLPLPDGGLLVLNRHDLQASVPPVRPPALKTAARLAYRALGIVEQAIGWTPRLAMLQQTGVRQSMHERVSAGPVEMVAGSPIAKRLLAAARPEFVIGRRRRNYARLLAACQNLDWATPLYSTLPEGVCPLGLPLVVEERDRFRDRLLGLGVNVRTYWEQLPPQVDLERFPDACWLSDRMLVLPTHQGVQSGGIEWLARLLPRLNLRPAGKRT